MVAIWVYTEIDTWRQVWYINSADIQFGIVYNLTSTIAWQTSICIKSTLFVLLIFERFVDSKNVAHIKLCTQIDWFFPVKNGREMCIFHMQEDVQDPHQS